MTDFDELIPEMREWNNGNGIDVGAWIGCSGNFQLAVGYSTIFWPRFVEFEGYVLRDGFSVDSLRGFQHRCAGDRKAVEAVMNHLHIADIQHYGCEDISRERIVYLGQVLREIYEAKLAWQFPQRRFEVHLYAPDTDDLLDYEITFFQTEGT
ncbi:MAG TPA: hypothetical protein VEL74_17175 [Thermoanaerobaculia bacterium]|nr:hypothetical protein [Thermoanaerobaculia bacterium]